MKFYILEERSKMYIDHYIGGGDSLLTANMDRDDVKVDLNPCHFFIKAVAGIKDNWQFITSPVLTRGFCIDNKLKSLLENYNIPTCEYHKMDCEFRKQPINYWWFRIHTQPIQQFIDISHSTFRNKSKEVITIPIENYLQEDYPLQAITWLDNHWINELSIHKDIEQYDMFCLRHFSSLYIVSERLKEAIEKHKFKGMTFQEATWLKII